MVAAELRTAVRGFGELKGLRIDLGVWLADLGVALPISDDVVLAVTELATNGVEASPTSEAQINASASDTRLQVEVANDGPPFRGLITSAAKTDRLPERGRGLDLVNAFVDSIHFGRAAGATTVVITKAY